MNQLRQKYLGVRYVLDRILAAVILIVISPVLLIIALIVLCSSGQPVLFRQQRIGRHGSIFLILKFRTMVKDAERIGGGYMPVGANLITPIGKLLRKTSLDELPQLINIIRGDMALIGPRPSLVGQYQRYTAFQRRRVEVLPGVTGLAQVTFRNDAPWSKRIALDIEYIDRANPKMDATILIRTLRKVFSGSGVLTDQTADQVDDLG